MEHPLEMFLRSITQVSEPLRGTTCPHSRGSEVPSPRPTRSCPDVRDDGVVTAWIAGGTVQ